MSTKKEPDRKDAHGPNIFSGRKTSKLSFRGQPSEGPRRSGSRRDMACRSMHGIVQVHKHYGCIGFVPFPYPNVQKLYVTVNPLMRMQPNENLENRLNHACCHLNSTITKLETTCLAPSPQDQQKTGRVACGELTLAALISKTCLDTHIAFWTGRLIFYHRLSPHHSPLLKLLPLAPDEHFTKQLQEKLRLVQFEQDIRRDLYGDAAEEYLSGHTPDAIRKEARAPRIVFDSSSESSSPRSLEDECRYGTTTAKAKRGRERSTCQLSLPVSVEKQSRPYQSESLQIWPSPPSSSHTNSPPNATAGEDSRPPKRKTPVDDDTKTVARRRSKRLRGERPIEASS